MSNATWSLPSLPRLARLAIFDLVGTGLVFPGDASLLVFEKTLFSKARKSDEPPVEAVAAGNGRFGGRLDRATHVISYFRSIASAKSATSSGSTASTISCTGMVWVLVPCMSELELIGTSRVRSGVTTTPSCTSGRMKLRFGSKVALGVATTLVPDRPALEWPAPGMSTGMLASKST